MIQIQLYQTEPQMYQIYGCQWDLSKPNWKKAKKGQKSDWEKSKKKYDYERKHKPNCSWVYYLLTLHVKESEHQKVSFVLVLPSLIWQNFSRTCQFIYILERQKCWQVLDFFKLSNGMALTLNSKKNPKNNYRDSLWNTCIPVNCKLTAWKFGFE